jgi:hypothetical protein
MSEVDFLVKLRDASAMVLDACETRLEKLAPVEVREDFDKLSWEEKQGKKEPFQQTNEKANNNSALWQTLRAKLKEAKGFWQHGGFKYWNDMQREDVIDRRKVA